MMIMMDAPKMEVKCGVDSCTYYNNNMCYAGKLEVNPMCSEAKTSDETCCTTFKPHSK